MATLDMPNLSDEIFHFVTTKKPVLFSGSGVGKPVGMPLWPEYLDHLANVCEAYKDVLSAQLIKQNVAHGNLIQAAGIYQLCSAIPDGERLKELAKPFTEHIEDAKLDLIKPVFELPFGAVVTTNYDRSQHDAFARARQRAPMQLELDDGTLRGGALRTGFFIAPVHGRAELPQSMVLFPNTYEQLDQNQIYKDFLLTLLNERPCLFLGFSFVDPAIRHVLTLYEKQAGPAYKTLHCALLPGDSSNELRQLLMKLNIHTHFYDPNESHRGLWRALNKAQARYKGGIAAPEPIPLATPDSARYSTLHRYFAFAYAQQRTSKELRPLLQQAREGLMLAKIRECGDDGISEAKLLAGIKDTLHLSQDETLALVRDSLARLLAEGTVRKMGENYFTGGPEPELLTRHLATLVSGVANRMKVREGIVLPTTDQTMVREGLERIFILRAWDLAAHYAGGGAGYGTDLNGVVHEVLADLAKSKAASELAAMERSVINLLTAPSDREAEHLAEVGRTAFGLQLVLSTPRQALLQRHSLPQIVYFDASVLLPTLVPGHPLRPVYRDAIKRLREAANQAGTRCELIVGRPFLNEIVSHREIALRLVRAQRLERPESLNRIISFYGAENVNVFVSAFATHVAKAQATGHKPPKFADFLNQVAPYQDENALAAYLQKTGIQVVAIDFRTKNNVQFIHVFNPLTSSYEKKSYDPISPKKKVLVQHEATQLVQLQLDAQSGNRSVFVSADRGLRRALLASPELRYFAGMVIPPEGFVGLVDIMVGLKADRRSLARLIWAAPRKDAEQATRDYLVRHALKQMDAAVASQMPDVIDRVVNRARQQIEDANFDMTSAHDVEDVARTARFMDRLEEDFFDNMKWWMEKHEEEVSKERKSSRKK